MPTYTLHVPEDDDPAAPEALDRAKLVADRFVWPAFWFSALWFFWHRLWLAGLLVLVAEVAVWGIGFALGLAPVAGFAIAVLLSLLIGFEASSLRRWTYERSGRPVRDVVTAADAGAAEVKLVARWAAGRGPDFPLAPVAAAVAPRAPASPVVGLFPEAEARR
ncbi:DUF2628 domain-containing protein [Methylobacterium oryzihabitans]|jgi:hypothetical protein|uniref:DUF2628 domain-containing protein n=1 Tax=Methylobacterium oryzihabitans TaxID=2499852 RepID=A0A3S2V5G7_9HYPH|nr:DUF2628 domain-containing protein [Methylobacterium oryzihabitans]RVU14044.1 DUF2628 domain-containing protein [Methylobacterium oryzihabitans]